MKRIIKRIGTLFLFAIYIVSCSDAMDIEQKGEGKPENVFDTLDDLQTGVNLVYLTYNPGFGDGNGQGDVILFNDLFTDNLRAGANNGSRGSQVYKWDIQTTHSMPERIWLNRYETINFANRYLEAAGLLENKIDPAEIDRLNHMKAELLALRAISHFDVFLYFTPNYNDPNALSAIIMDHVRSLTEEPHRNTVQEVIEFISNDLNQALSLIDQGQTNRYYINVDVINAFRTKIALVTGDYALAGDLASNLLAKYPLANRTNYVALFDDSTATPAELIFGLTRVLGNSRVAASWYANAVNITGTPIFEMSRQLYDLFYVGDVRIDQVLLHNTSIVSENRLLINKYPGGSEDTLLNDLKIIRSSEMALILAEVQARNGDYVGSATTLQTLIDARYGTNPKPPIDSSISFSNQTDALNRILLERRKELCFEGHRFVDLKRLGVGINRSQVDMDSFEGSQQNLPPTDYRFTLPIPQLEMNGNTNAVQNTGYN